MISTLKNKEKMNKSTKMEKFTKELKSIKNQMVILKWKNVISEIEIL